MICISDDDDNVEPTILNKNGTGTKDNHVDLSEICNENKVLVCFINECLKLEYSKEMVLTINKILLPQYLKTDKSVRQSMRVKEAIQQAYNNLKKNPKDLYSNINNVYKILQFKKKVPFTTIISKENFQNRRLPAIGAGLHMDVINIDSDDEADNTCNESTDGKTVDDHENSHEIESVSKKPKIDTINLNVTKVLISEPIDSNDLNGNIVDNSKNVTEKGSEEGCSKLEKFEDKLLIPNKVVVYESTVDNNEDKIKKIENKIAYYKKRIAQLDEEEVDDDSVNSPYIKSERLKAAIVALYEEMCQLTGENAVKRREIRLEVKDGHPQGPTKMLETFLNKNIGPDGDPPFPDFCDVVRCVTKANANDNLGWSKAQVEREACFLFTQCGTALQKRRQNRDWRDLLSRLKSESDHDPAERDPQLLARLEDNKRIGQKNEKELLERYTMLQFLPPQPKVPKDESSNMCAENYTNESNLKTDLKCSSHEEITNNINVNNSICDKENQITATSNKDNSSRDQGICSNEIDIIGNNLNANNTQFKQPSSPNCNRDSEMDDSNVQNNTIDSIYRGDESYHEFVAREIKQEPGEDNVITQLNNFGDNYTVTIKLLEDSVLTIQVLDSSDEE